MGRGCYSHVWSLLSRSVISWDSEVLGAHPLVLSPEIYCCVLSTQEGMLVLLGAQELSSGVGGPWKRRLPFSSRLGTSRSARMGHLVYLIWIYRCIHVALMCSPSPQVPSI